MGSVVSGLFGGTDTTALRDQQSVNKLTRDFIQQQGGTARTDIRSNFRRADINRNLGIQSTLDVLGQGGQAQLGAFQQGNVGAQNTLLAGLPQFQNAILGAPVDLSGLRPQQVNVDTSFLQQRLPKFRTRITKKRGPGKIVEPIGPPGEIDALRTQLEELRALFGQFGQSGIPRRFQGDRGVGEPSRNDGIGGPGRGDTGGFGDVGGMGP